jgi:hypothetical protein
MFCYFRTVFLSAIIFTTTFIPAYASRFALIIGNGDYQHIPKLHHPVNDAHDMGAILKTLGFQVVVKRNADKKTMVKAVQDLGKQLSHGGVGLFYFSGHGLQSKNLNYLVPVDALINSEADIEFEGFDANRVLAQMEQAKNEVNFVILDTSQDNPYKTSTFKGLLRNGLAKMDSPPGTLIAFATAPNKPSWAGKLEERNSVYTKHLLAALLRSAHWSVPDLFIDVRDKVMEETKDKKVPQAPWESISLRKRFCFGTCASSHKDLGLQRAELERQRIELERQRALLEREKSRQKEEAILTEQTKLKVEPELAEQSPQKTSLAKLKAEQSRQSEEAGLKAEQERLARQEESEKREVAQKLRECEKHFQADRLTSGKGITALACYQWVLKKDPNNAQALTGLKHLEAHYITGIKRAFFKGQRNKAKQYLAILRKVNPQSSKLAILETQFLTLSLSNRYTNNGNGTVTDNKNGLIWLKNANCFGEHNWKIAMQSAAKLAHGRCGLRDASRQGMWRLPTKDEWKAMIDKKYVDRNYSQPAISNAAGTGKWTEGDAFSGVQASDYWSSTTDADNDSHAWSVYLDYGYVGSNDKAYTYYVWPVRDKQ